MLNVELRHDNESLAGLQFWFMIHTFCGNRMLQRISWHCVKFELVSHSIPLTSLRNIAVVKAMSRQMSRISFQILRPSYAHPIFTSLGSLSENILLEQIAASKNIKKRLAHIGASYIQSCGRKFSVLESLVCWICSKDQEQTQALARENDALFKTYVLRRTLGIGGRKMICCMLLKNLPTPQPHVPLSEQSTGPKQSVCLQDKERKQTAICKPLCNTWLGKGSSCSLSD